MSAEKSTYSIFTLFYYGSLEHPVFTGYSENQAEKEGFH